LDMCKSGIFDTKPAIYLKRSGMYGLSICDKSSVTSNLRGQGHV